MKIMKPDRTIEIYNEKAEEFIERYEKADMSALQWLMLEYLEPGSKVLDIGFGSGRDLAFLKDHGMEIWGVDPAENFVKNAKERFSVISDHFAVAGLPNLSLPEHFPEKFDAILLIAVWMHIPQEIQNESVRKICTLLKKGGRIVLSYSIGSRSDDERFFEDLDSEKVSTMFEENGCKKIHENSNRDGLGRDSITWITEIYKTC